MQTDQSNTDWRMPLLGNSDHLFRAYLLLLAIEILGLAQVVPLLAAARVSTLLAWGLILTVVVRVGLRAFFEYSQSRLLVAFVGFTGLTVAYAVVQTSALTAFRIHLDYFGLFLITAYLVDRPARVRKLALMLSLIVVAMVARNLDPLTSAGRQEAMAGAYFTGDGNDFAWALCIFLPIALFLTYRQQAWGPRILGAVAVVACVFGVMGTQSRGAALAVVAMGTYYFVALARRRALALGVAAALVAALVTLGPTAYVERLATVGTYEEDGSAAGRLKMWGVAVQMAVDYPFGVGAGNFNVAYGLRYLPKEEETYTWGSRRWLSAHSIYFRTLGEYGFVGLILLLITIGTSFAANEQSHRLAREQGSSAEQRAWPRLLNMSLIGYAVGGTFLGGLTYPHLYLLSALAASAKAMTMAEPAKAEVERVPSESSGRVFAAAGSLAAPKRGAAEGPWVPGVIRPQSPHAASAPLRSVGPR
ncbi:MAG: O-antigen ligase family protein [Acidobacteria bacterium]|nr:O-antigen ligase family protein [Acidobacteriota bacterium]